MMPLANPVTVKVQRQVDTDRNGNPILGGDHTIDGCAHMPRDTSELAELARDTVITGEYLYGPVDADLLPQDYVWLPRDDWDAAPRWFVDGDVERYDDFPFGDVEAMHFFQAVLTRVEG
jgi:hypothetical protein